MSDAPSGGRDPSLTDAATVAEGLGADPRAGLSAAETASRLVRLGHNRLDPMVATSVWRRLLAQFADPLVYLLLVATVVSVTAWALEGAHGLPVDGIVIAAIVIANGVLGFLQERSAERAVEALQRMAAPTAHVVRDGRDERMAAEDVVPGDMLVIEAGMP